MHADFSSVRNRNEREVFDAVLRIAARYPAVRDNAALLRDVACVALNRLPARYIQHEADFAFYRADSERLETQRRVDDAVDYAFGFVQARTAMRARG